MSLGYYPNPSSGEFKVSLDKTAKLPAELSIYDMAGLKIYHSVLTRMRHESPSARQRRVCTFFRLRVMPAKVGR